MIDPPITRRLVNRKELPGFGLKPPKDTVYVNVFSVVDSDGNEVHFFSETEAEAHLNAPSHAPTEDTAASGD